MMSLKHIASASIAVIASVALAATMSMPANAAPSIGASGQTVVTASNQSETNNLAEKMKALKSGESFTYSSPTGRSSYCRYRCYCSSCCSSCNWWRKRCHCGRYAKWRSAWRSGSSSCFILSSTTISIARSAKHAHSEEAFGKFTRYGVSASVPSLPFVPWLVLGAPATLVCQAVGIFTVLSFGLFFAYPATHLSSPVAQKVGTGK